MRQNPGFEQKYASPISTAVIDDLLCAVPQSFIDSLTTYSFIPTPDDVSAFLRHVLDAYVQEVSKPPMTYDASQRSSYCEICHRDWIPLTYHHLIPRQVHAKAVKRGWHEEWQLEKVAWLCRQCHSLVHRIATNEELARDWSSIELLMQRDDVQSFAKWLGRARWKPK